MPKQPNQLTVATLTHDDEDDLKGYEKKEAEQNNEAARLWISGLEAVNRKLGVARVIDLSATPSSSVLTISTKPSKLSSRPKSTKKPGLPSTATPSASSISRSLGGSR